jgi:hypothetical protein
MKVCMEPQLLLGTKERGPSTEVTYGSYRGADPGPGAEWSSDVCVCTGRMEAGGGAGGGLLEHKSR